MALLTRQIAQPEDWEEVEEETGGDQPQKTQKKLGGFVWWIILGALIFFDIASVLLNMLMVIGVGLSATGVGAVIGIPISVLAWGLGMLLTFTAFLIGGLYFWLNGVSLLGAKKLFTMFSSVIIEIVPLLSFLPSASLSFIFITLWENGERGGGILGAVASKVPR